MIGEAASAFALLDEEGQLLARSARLEQLLACGVCEQEVLDRLLESIARSGAGVMEVELAGRPARLWSERAGRFLVVRVDTSPSQGDERLHTFALLAEGMSHDARNPLNSIAIHLGLMRERLAVADAELAGRFERHLRAMRDGVNRVEATLRRFMQFVSPAPSGDPVDLAELVGRAVDAFGHEARRQGVTVETALEGVEVEADAAALGEAVLQLVSEGIAGSTMGSRLEVRVNRSGAEALLALREFAAEPPECAEAEVSGRRAEGTLPFAERIVELHRGSLRLRKEATGRQVEVRLPIAGR